MIQNRYLADDLESATGSFYKEYIPPDGWPQNCQRRASSGGAMQPSPDLIPTKPQKAIPGRLNKFIDSPSSDSGLFGDAHGNVPPVRCATEAPFLNGVLLD